MTLPVGFIIMDFHFVKHPAKTNLSYAIFVLFKFEMKKLFSSYVQNKQVSLH